MRVFGVAGGLFLRRDVTTRGSTPGKGFFLDTILIEVMTSEVSSRAQEECADDSGSRPLQET